MKITLKEAKEFHGHLGPYLALGILAGELALKKLKCKKYFGLQVKVWGAQNRPKSCLIDGLQLSTGATYGKGNIQKNKGQRLRILFCNTQNNRKIMLVIRKEVLMSLDKLKGHRDSEILAKKLYEEKPTNFFQLITHNS